MPERSDHHVVAEQHEAIAESIQARPIGKDEDTERGEVHRLLVALSVRTRRRRLGRPARALALDWSGLIGQPVPMLSNCSRCRSPATGGSVSDLKSSSSGAKSAWNC